MADEFQLVGYLRLLAEYGVDYLIVGGVGGRIQGAATTTGDIDIMLDPSPANLDRLAAALSGRSTAKKEARSNVYEPHATVDPMESRTADVSCYLNWGETLGGPVFVWCSGIGIDARGNLVDAAGELDIVSLADVLRAAGAVRAMELDINSYRVSFDTFLPRASGPRPTKLLPNMERSANRYLVPGTRYFVAMYAR